MKRIYAALTLLSGIVGALAAIQAGLAQILPKAMQDWFNQRVEGVVQTYLSSECNLTGNWVCETVGCLRPPARQATIKEKNYELVFQNERPGDPETTGVWVRPRLVFVPRYDPAHGGDFGRVSKSCDRIEWSDGGAVWKRCKVDPLSNKCIPLQTAEMP